MYFFKIYILYSFSQSSYSFKVNILPEFLNICTIRSRETRRLDHTCRTMNRSNKQTSCLYSRHSTHFHQYCSVRPCAMSFPSLSRGCFYTRACECQRNDSHRRSRRIQEPEDGGIHRDQKPNSRKLPALI